MWLIKFHIALSILCIITFWGFSRACKEQIKKNGWLDENKKKKVSLLLFFFVPIMNVILLCVLFMMISVSKEKFEEYTKYVEKESEENE